MTARPLAAAKRHPIWTLLGAATALVVLFALMGDWNWFRPLVASRIAAALQRPVTLQHFDVADVLSRQPEIVLDGIAIGNPPGFPDGSETGSIARLGLRFDLPALIKSGGHRIIVTELILDHPQGDLRPGPQGHPNWEFPLGQGEQGQPSAPPQIGAIVITDGDFRFADPRIGADLRVKLRTQPAAKDGEASLVVDAQGTYQGQAFTGHFVGGSVLGLRNTTQPYPVDLRAQSGKTKVRLAGTVEDPQHLAGANLQLRLEGEDLADLYKLFHLPFQPSPPFSLQGHLDYADRHIRFRDFSGRVGQSDLAGDFDVDRSGARPRVTADLTSRNVELADLAGFIGAPPGKENAPTEGAKQRAEHAAQEAKPTLLPDTPIDLGKIRSTDYQVHYRGEHIVTSWAPLDRLDATLTIDHGDIKLQPLNFAVGTGTIASTIELDGRQDPVAAKADIDFRHVDFQRMMATTHVFKGFGNIGGRWAITARGNSLAQMLAHGNGTMSLFMGSGSLSALLVDLAGLDLGSSIASLLGIPDTAKINCMVSDFALENGVLASKAMVLDTDQANVFTTGAVDLANETLDLQITQEGKHFSIGALHAPIDISGTFKDPHVLPDPKALGIRGGVAAALGAVFPPAALLATIQLGLGKDHNCGALIRAAQASGRPQVSANPSPRPAPPPAQKPETLRRR